MAFDFAPLIGRGGAVKWPGWPKYNFTFGNNAPEEIPIDDLRAAVDRTLVREGRRLAEYRLEQGPQGYRPLREFLVKKLKRDAAIDCTIDDILIVSGSLQALDLINGALLAPGDTVICERDNYEGTLNRFTRRGVKAVPIPLDKDGMRMDALEAELAALKRKGIRPKFIYTIATVQNPTATVLPLDRRKKLLSLAEEHGVPIVEDDCYADLTWDGARPPAIYALSKSQNVIHVGSFSKTIAPALRLGFVIAPWAIPRACWRSRPTRHWRPRADDAGRILREAFCRACHRVTTALPRQARHAGGGAQRAVRHRGRVRLSAGWHFSVGEAAGQCRHHEAARRRARSRRIDQSGPGVVGR